MRNIVWRVEEKQPQAGLQEPSKEEQERMQKRCQLYDNMLDFAIRVSGGGAESDTEIKILPKMIKLITNDASWRW